MRIRSPPGGRARLCAAIGARLPHGRGRPLGAPATLRMVWIRRLTGQISQTNTSALISGEQSEGAAYGVMRRRCSLLLARRSEHCPSGRSPGFRSRSPPSIRWRSGASGCPRTFPSVAPTVVSSLASCVFAALDDEEQRFPVTVARPHRHCTDFPGVSLARRGSPPHGYSLCGCTQGSIASGGARRQGDAPTPSPSPALRERGARGHHASGSPLATPRRRPPRASARSPSTQVNGRTVRAWRTAGACQIEGQAR